MTNAETILFQELERLIQKAVTELSEQIVTGTGFKFWCADKLAVEAFELHKPAIGAAIVEILRVKLAEHDLALMAGFDGSSRMAANGRQLSVVDQDGNALASDLHSRLMEYFSHRGLA